MILRTRVLASVVVVIAAAAVAACGGSQPAKPATPAAPAAPADECQRFVDKSRPTVLRLAQETGHTVEETDFTTMVSDCRAREPGKDQATMDCVLGAADDDAVYACWKTAMEEYRGEPKAQP